MELFIWDRRLQNYNCPSVWLLYRGILSFHLWTTHLNVFDKGYYLGAPSILRQLYEAHFMSSEQNESSLLIILTAGLGLGNCASLVENSAK